MPGTLIWIQSLNAEIFLPPAFAVFFLHMECSSLHVCTLRHFLFPEKQCVILHLGVLHYYSYLFQSVIFYHNRNVFAYSNINVFAYFVCYRVGLQSTYFLFLFWVSRAHT